MSLDRQSIEKRDFPIGRRGYDPEAVDAHLARIANEVEELKLASHQRTENVAASAGERVRAIVEAAESSAAEIQRQAVDDARELRSEAAEESATARSQATGQAREYVGRVSESTATMIQRLDAMQTELGTLLETLRTGSNRINADLQLLEGNLVDVRGAVLPHERIEDESSAAAPDAGAGSEAGAVSAEQIGGASGGGDAGVPEVAGVGAPSAWSSTGFGSDSSPGPSGGGEINGTWPAADPEVAGEQGDSLFEEAEPELSVPDSNGAVATADGSGTDSAPDDVDGARLIALNMALDGAPREETARYLSEHYRLLDPQGLLDEVYTSVQG